MGGGPRALGLLCSPRHSARVGDRALAGSREEAGGEPMALRHTIGARVYWVLRHGLRRCDDECDVRKLVAVVVAHL